MYEAFNLHGLEASFAFYGPEIVWYSDPSFPDGGCYSGFEAVSKYQRGMVDNWKQIELRIDELVVRGNRVLALLDSRSVGRQDVEVNFFWGQLWTVEDGLMVEVRSFLDREAALAAIEGPG